MPEPHFSTLFAVMVLRVFLFLAAASAASAALNANVEEVFGWNSVSFNWPAGAEAEALKSGDYVPGHNLPLGLDRWRDRLFVTVPRWKSGVAATLNYISLTTPINKTGALTPYPDWKSNLLPKEGEKPTENHIVSTFRVKVDRCDRLWVMDTGLADILGKPRQVSPPAIVIYDLKTDQLIRRYTLQESDQKEDSFFANIVIDENPDNCNDVFAYLPDLGGYCVVVYSFAENTSWRVRHNFFHFDPLKGDFNVGGVNFQWTDGVFALALGPRLEDGSRTVYFHPLSSTREFSVSSNVLRNKTVATTPESYYRYKVEGNRGDLTQSSSSDFDIDSNVLFLTQLNRDGVACWNPKKPLNAQNFGLIVEDHEALIFTNDLKIDQDRNLWFLSDRMPTFIYKDLNPREKNYRIFRAKIDDLIKDSVCA